MKMSKPEQKRIFVPMSGVIAALLEQCFGAGCETKRALRFVRRSCNFAASSEVAPREPVLEIAFDRVRFLAVYGKTSHEHCRREDFGVHNGRSYSTCDLRAREALLTKRVPCV